MYAVKSITNANKDSLFFLRRGDSMQTVTGVMVCLYYIVCGDLNIGIISAIYRSIETSFNCGTLNQLRLL